MDAADFPFWKGSVSHHFSGKLKLYVAVKAVSQIEGDETSEIDFETGIKLFKHVKITSIFSRAETIALPNDMYGTLKIACCILV